METSVHLSHQANLDALGLDDRINTGRIDVDRAADPDPLLDTCGRLMDAFYDWWNGRPPPIVYRARTTPAGRNVVFAKTARPRVEGIRRLREATSLLVYLVMQAGFTVPGGWLETDRPVRRKKAILGEESFADALGSDRQRRIVRQHPGKR